MTAGRRGSARTNVPAMSYRPPPWLSELVLAVALVPVLVVAVRSPAPTAEALTYLATDGVLFRSVGEVLLAGGNPYDPVELDTRIAAHLGAVPPDRLPFAYPPVALPLFLLHAFATPRAGFVLAVLVGTVLALAAARRLAPPREVADDAFLAVGIGAGGAARLNASLGQTGSFAGALGMGLAATLDAPPIAAGTLLGLLSFKPQYAVPVAMLLALRGRWLTIGVAAAVTASLALLSGALWGLHTWPAWVAELGRHNASLDAMVTWRSLHPALRDPAWNLPALAVWGLAVLGAAILVRRLDGERAVAALFPLCIAFSPNTHAYDLFLWIPAGIVVARDLGLRPALGVVVVGLVTHAVALDAVLGTGTVFHAVLWAVGVALGLAAARAPRR